jgi:hypothetical protein
LCDAIRLFVAILIQTRSPFLDCIGVAPASDGKMVDPNYTFVVKVAKKYLRSAEVMNGMHRKMRAK